LRAVFFISLGAIVGANARYFVGLWAVQALGAAFPYGTLIINVTGSFLIGLILTFLTDRVIDEPAWRLILVTGFCGGYTTFSTYTFEAMTLMREGSHAPAALYVVGSTALALVGVAVGTVVARLV
jgi:CrcB protein